MNYNIIYTLLIVVSTLGFVSLGCSSRKHPKTKEELIQYTNESANGLIQQTTVGTYKITATYQPRGLAPSCTPCNDYAYFIIKIGSSNAAQEKGFLDSQAFAESIETLAFRMGDAVKLITGKDSISPADYTFQRTFGMTKQGSFLFVFPRKTIDSNGKFSILIKANALIEADAKLTFDSEKIQVTQAFNML